MTEEQKYLFDLQGYLILEQVVPSEIVDACNRSLDQYEATDESDYPLPLQLGQDRSPENLYISNILEGDPAFRPLIDIPEVIDVIESISGATYRLNHTYTIYRWGGGYTGLHMHGTPIIDKCQYRCQNGQIVSTLTKAVFPMLDSDFEDGCFAGIPGSHKSNFEKPWGRHPEENPPLVPIPAKAGDCVIFTEAMTHGSFVNTSGKPRRTVYFCYSIGWMKDWGGQHLEFSDQINDGLTEQQQEIIRLK
jgi:hypothetical protein